MAHVTLAQAAEILRVSPSTVYRRVKDGTLPAVRLGGRGPVLIPEPALEAALKRYTHPSMPRPTASAGTPSAPRHPRKD